VPEQDSITEAHELAVRGHIAARAFASATQEDVDRITAAMARAGTEAAERLGGLPAGGETVRLDVYAVQPWNWTGLYLVEGEYELKATGEWLDRTGPHEADGARAGRPQLDFSALTNAAAGWLKERLKKLTRDEAVTFFGTRRLGSAPWMALLGAVAAPAFDRNGSQVAYRQFAIPTRGTVLHVDADSEGYLYCYANDAWGMYGDNRGSLSVTITRTA